MEVWPGSAAVGVAREPALTDQALAPPPGLQADNGVSVSVVSVGGWLVDRHSRTVSVQRRATTGSGSYTHSGK